MGSVSARPDHVVIGAGMIGLCLAWRLSEAGHRVTVVDMGGPMGGSSHTNGALVTANEKRPFSYHALGRSSIEEMGRLPDELGDGHWLLRTGHVEWGVAASAEALERRLEELRPWDYPVQRLTPEDIAELEPELVVPPEVKWAAFFREDSILYPHLLAALILRRLRRLGVELRFGAGTVSLTPRSGGGYRVVGANTSIEADSVVVCAGRWTQELVAGLGFDIPMLSAWGPTPEALGFQVITAPAPVQVQRMIRMPGLSIRPAGGGRLMLHGRPEEAQLHVAGSRGRPWDVPLDPLPEQAEAMVSKARGVLLNAGSLRAQSAALSVRALPYDGLPVVGPVPGHPGVYAVTTHSGIGLAPLLGRLCAGELCGQAAAELDDFRPARFEGSAWRTRVSPMRETHPDDAPTN